MASSVRSRPNHYEVLGLPATASQDDIKQAFVKAMGMFGARRVATAADIGLAFEVLRDPIKRRAYDSALGLAPEPTRWTIGEPQRSGTGFISWGSTATAHRAVPDSAPPPFTEVEPQHEPELRREPQPPAEPGLASILASLRELSKQDAREAVPEFRQPPPAGKAADPRPAPLPKPEPKIEPQVEQLLAAHWEERQNPKAEAAAIDWKWAGLGVGGLVLVAGLVGALGGLTVKDAEQSQWAKPAVTVPLPTATEEPSLAIAPPPKGFGGNEFQPARPVHEIARARTTHEISQEQPTPAAQPPSGETVTLASASDQSPPEVVASDPLAVDAPAAQAVASSLPLPNSVIARTIERIGYSCGEVSSTAAVEGAPGIFKVTCSSGQSYQAAPVRGRYHFRRLAH